MISQRHRRALVLEKAMVAMTCRRFLKGATAAATAFALVPPNVLGGAESSHRSATLLHLANIAIRTGRKIRYDPVKEEIIGAEEANRLVNQPMRAPWHL